MPLAIPKLSSTQDSTLPTQCPQSPRNTKQEKQTFECFSDCHKRFKPPPTPPPPPCVTYIPSSTRIASKTSCSLILSNISSPRNSYSSLGSSRTPQRDLPSSPQIQTPQNHHKLHLVFHFHHHPHFHLLFQKELITLPKAHLLHLNCLNLLHWAKMELHYQN